MKIRLSLGEADRQRYDCPEWMEFDWLTVSGREAVALQVGATIEGAMIGFDSPTQWRQAFLGHPVEGVMVPVVGDDGEQLLDDDGNGVEVQARKPDQAAMYVGVWLALRRYGQKLPLSEVDYDRDAVRVQFDLGDDEGESGKDESGPETTS